MPRSHQHSGDIQCPVVTSSNEDIFKYNYSLFRVQRGRRQIHTIPINNFDIPPFIGVANYPRIPMHPDPDNNPRERNASTSEFIGSTRGAIISVIFIFLCSILALTYVYTNFPNLEQHEKPHIKVPWNIDEAKNLGKVLSRYKEKYYFEVLSGVCVTYVFLQTFAIPGSLFLSILSGFLFPFFMALVLVCSCSAIGASLCYLLSQLLGRRIVFRYFPDRARAWSQTVAKHKDNLLNYMLFLRITPFIPNWFINLTAPVIGVPLYPFVLGTFLGVAPPSFVAIQAGQTLQNMTSSNDTFSWTSVILLSVFAILSMIPVLLRDRIQEKFE